MCPEPAMTRIDPIHPGEVLKHDFMEPMGLSATALAGAIGVTPARISEIVRGRRGITAETVLRLARYFGTDARSWTSLQDRHEFAVAERERGAALSAAQARRSTSWRTAKPTPVCTVATMCARRQHGLSG